MEKAVTGSVKKSLSELHKRTLAIQERVQKEEEERLESGVVYLPTWREGKQGSPNSFLRSVLFAAIQSKDRVYLKEAEMFSQQGVSVSYTGEQLNQEDMTVWLALVDLMKKDPLGKECKFTAHEILKYMGLEIGGSGYERLETSISRMTACLVKIKTERFTYGESLIEGFVIDEYTKKYKVRLNRKLIKLFGDDDWTAIDWEYYGSHEKPYPISLEFLSDLTGCKNSQKASFKRQVKTALKGLIKIGFLKSWSIENDIVNVERIYK
jgi:hypothetical protein